MKILLFLTLLCFSTTSEIDSQISFSPDLASHFSNSLVPIINNKVNEAQIDDINLKKSGISINISSINQHVDVPTDSFAFEFVAPNSIIATASRINGQINAKVKLKYGIIHETDDCKVTLINTSLRMEIDLLKVDTIDGNIPQIGIRSADVSTDMTIDIKGKLIAKIASWFKGEITNIVIKKIKELVKKSGPFIETLVNRASCFVL